MTQTLSDGEHLACRPHPRGSVRRASGFVLTDYPGGVSPVIPFSTRRKLDLGLAAMKATMPRFLNFEDEPERKFFTAQGLVMTVAAELTRFQREDEIESRDRRWAA